MPTKISFTDGSTVKYSYSADGEKLSADYDLTLMNVMNGTSNPTQAGGGVKLHRDYCGDFIYEDGALKTMLFDGGYVTFAGTPPEYHFYLKDHLGNNRVVASADGDIEQVNHYYPLGGLMAESKGKAQSYKYNGKELDRMHGLDSYDYGARWMTNGRFFTPDPHATDYPNVSPYAYCGNNPVCSIDINGKDSYYANDGKYLFGNLKETDFIYIVSGYNVIRQLSNGTELVELFGKQSFMDARLSAEAYSNIFTDVLKRNNFDVQNLENGKISVYVLDSNIKGDGPQYQDEDSFNNPTMYPWKDADVAVTHTTDKKSNITANVVWCDKERLNYLSTISNIVSVLGVHELTGHVLMHMKNEEHWKILKMQREYPTWDKTTESLKSLYLYLEKIKKVNI